MSAEGSIGVKSDVMKRELKRELKKENSYKSILKGTSAFGGVQLFLILVNLVRGKFVALFLGPSGMGVSALFSTAAGTVQQFSSLGLNLAIVKEVAARKEDGAGALSVAMAVARRLIYATAIVGALVCALFAEPLSRLTFGSDEYTLWFVALSLMIFFAIAGAGELSMLQGLHAVKRLSLSSLVGAVCGLIVGVPLYKFFGTAGIVPAMIVLAFATWSFYLYSVRKETRGVGRTVFAWREHSPLIKKLIGLGLVLMAANLIGTVVNYAVAAYVRHASSVTTVGYYQAANSLTNQYIGMVFSAMALDYFPRLSAAASDNALVKSIVNRQTEIVSLIVTPLIVLLIFSSPLIVRLLLTKSFLPVVPLMRWMGVGILFRALMFPLGYISFAKDDKRLYFMLEGVLGNTLSLIFSIVLFTLFDLIGLGVAILVDASVSLLIYRIVNGRRYSFSYSRRSLSGMLYAVAAGGAAFGCSFIPSEALSYTLMSIIFAATLLIGIINVRRLLLSDRKESLEDKEPDSAD